MGYQIIAGLEIVQDLGQGAGGDEHEPCRVLDSMDNREFREIVTTLDELNHALNFERSSYEEMRELNFSNDSIEDVDEDWLLSTDSLGDIDFGMGSIVAVLSLLGCSTVTSCRGDCLGTGHAEAHPLVVFFAENEQIALVLEAAKRAEVGLCRYLNAFQLYADDLLKMHRMAELLQEKLAQA